MADYDASIRVSTKVDTSQTQRLQIQITKATDKVARLSAKYEELRKQKIPTADFQEISKHVESAIVHLSKLVEREEEMIATGRNSGKAWDVLQYRIEGARNTARNTNKELQELIDTGKAFTLGGDSKEAEQLAHSLELAEAELQALLTKESELNAKREPLVDEKDFTDVEELVKGFREAEKSSERFFSTTQKGAKRSSGLIKLFTNRIKKMALTAFIFSGVRKAFNSMVSSTKEGFANLAKYSKTYNASVSALKSECAQLKNGMAAAFEPVANIILPYITKLVSWLNTAADTVSRFWAALSGKSTYTRAKKQVLDYAKSLDTASNAAKGALASFDSINVLTSNSGSGSAGGEATGADAFEEAEVGDGMQAILDAIKPFQESIEEWIQNLDFEPILTAFDNLKTAVQPIVGHLSDGLKFFLDEILLPLGSWVIEDALPAFFDLLSAALEAFDAVWGIVQPSLAWLWDNFLAPAAEWVGDAIVEGIKAITEKLKAFSDWATSNEENMEIVKGIVLGLLAGIVFYYSVKGIVGMITAIKDAFSKFGGILEWLDSPLGIIVLSILALVAGIMALKDNWGKLNDLGKVETVLIGLAAAAAAAAIAMTVFHISWSLGVAAAAILAGIVAMGLSSSILSQLSGTSASNFSSSSGTKSGGGSLKAAATLYNSTQKGNPLPALATGGITTRPTTALIGEAGREAVLPLENNTEWMDTLANRINPNVTIRFEGTLAELGRMLKPVIDTENARVGTSYKN